MSESDTRDPQMAVLNPRPRGRPRASEPHTAVSTWLPASEHDRLIRRANREGLSLSSLVRDWLKELR